ncbi:MAG: hypothetical protein MMC33_006636 [Icmadophila ericetorum]|nr:hypothetical protein [Icmadophila ericetorum]
MTLDTVSDHSAVDQHICCCSHGARCSCAVKKDHHLDPVPETDIADNSPSPASTDSARKPRLPPVQSQSEGSLTVFVNGHHKPAHKHNDAAHKCGVPYKIPRPHTIHGHSAIAQKSMDSLPLVRTLDDDPLKLHDSIYSAQQQVRLVRSEHGSPEMRPMSNNQFNAQLPPLDLSYSTYNNFTVSPLDDYNAPLSTGYESYFTSPDDQPAFSAGLAMPPFDWAALDSRFQNGTFTSPFSQPPSYASYDHSNVGQPGLTASSSGDVSEGEDYGVTGDPSPIVSGNNPYTSAVSESITAEDYGLNSDYLSSIRPSSHGNDNLDIDTYIPGATASPASFEEFNSSGPVDPETFTRHGITVEDAQKLAHNGVPTDAMGDLSIPSTRDHHNGIWATEIPPDVPFNEEEANFDEADFAQLGKIEDYSTIIKSEEDTNHGWSS